MTLGMEERLEMDSRLGAVALPIYHANTEKKIHLIKSVILLRPTATAPREQLVKTN
jgi:hypothetical protein